MARPNLSPYLVSVLCHTRSIHVRAHRSALPPLRSQPLYRSPSLLARRLYATSTPEPPDYLDEAELHIFNKIKSELQPARLEVGF